MNPQSNVHANVVFCIYLLKLLTYMYACEEAKSEG